MPIIDVFLSPKAKAISLACLVVLTLLYISGIDTETTIIHSLWSVFLVIGFIQRVSEWKEKPQNRT